MHGVELCPEHCCLGGMSVPVLDDATAQGLSCTDFRFVHLTKGLLAMFRLKHSVLVLLHSHTLAILQQVGGRRRSSATSLS